MLVTKDTLKEIALGATLLGSGGGGDPASDLKLATYFCQKYGPVSLIDLEDVSGDSLIVPVGFMGSPSVAAEMLINGNEFDAMQDAIEEHFQKKIGALVATEIGGSNSLIPFIYAAKKGLAVVDGDTLGRAFPELQMSTCSLFNIQAAPCFIADSLGNMQKLVSENIEDEARKLCCKMGSNALVAIYIMTKSEAKRALITKTVTRAKELGKSSAQDSLTHLAEGVVVDIQTKNTSGFLEGKIVLDNGIEILFQNEYLIARRDKTVYAVTPDIICLIEKEKSIALTVENVKFGMQVLLAKIDSPAIWKTEAGLKLVGPEVFGYEV